MEDSTANTRLRARVAAMTDSEREACVESVYATDSPTPEMLDEFTLIMLGGERPCRHH
jgi:hypothetical protein